MDMKYKEGKINRVFLVTFSHGENFLEGIKDFIQSKKIQFGSLNIIGALTESDIVTGPTNKECPPEPNFKKIDDVREIIGFGLLTTNSEGKVTLHIHGGFGKGDSSVVGCLRKGGEVFVTIEVIVTEIDGIHPKSSEFHLLNMLIYRL